MPQKLERSEAVKDALACRNEAGLEGGSVVRVHGRGGAGRGDAEDKLAEARDGEVGLERGEGAFVPDLRPCARGLPTRVCTRARALGLGPCARADLRPGLQAARVRARPQTLRARGPPTRVCTRARALGLRPCARADL